MTAPADAYEQLSELIELELKLVCAHQFDDLPEVARRRTQLLELLPATPPPEARNALLRCQAIQAQVTAELLRARDALLETSTSIERARRAARGYQPPRVTAPIMRAEA